MQYTNRNEEIVIKTLVEDKEYDYLASYKFNNMTFGSGTAMWKGVYVQYAANKEQTTLNLLKALNIAHEDIYNEIFSSSLIPITTVEKIVHAIKNELFLAICVDKFIEKHKTVDLLSYTTEHSWNYSHFLLSENVFYLDSLSKEIVCTIYYTLPQQIEHNSISELNDTLVTIKFKDSNNFYKFSSKLIEFPLAIAKALHGNI